MDFPVYVILDGRGVSENGSGKLLFSGTPKFHVLDFDGQPCLPLFESLFEAEAVAKDGGLVGRSPITAFDRERLHAVLVDLRAANPDLELASYRRRIYRIEDLQAWLARSSDTPAETSPTTDQSSQPREHLN